MSADWAGIEDAIVTLVETYSGLGTGQVLWSESNAGRPAGSFITLRIGDVAPYTLTDEVQILDHSGEEDVEEGEEIEMKVVGRRSFGLTLQCYVPPANRAVPRGDSSPRTILNKVGLAFSLPSAGDSLEAVGAAVEEVGPIQYIPEIVGAGFEGRAVLQMRFRVTDDASEFTTYIGRVQATGEEGLDQPGAGPDVDVNLEE